ncbi:reverse ribonuclease integrase [Lasius niger]|uniref:Reverse ribonuclease integrase n=1 Tax=Lasius niger TaxID=67767 RepID=A0A0J7K3L5_LASNI|nr:reverse ribonuclease integrase [Lasius niger]
MFRDTADHVKRCDTCQRTKVEQAGAAGLMGHRVVKGPWTVIATDIMGPFPKSKSGFATAEGTTPAPEGSTPTVAVLGEITPKGQPKEPEPVPITGKYAGETGTIPSTPPHPGYAQGTEPAQGPLSRKGREGTSGEGHPPPIVLVGGASKNGHLMLELSRHRSSVHELSIPAE